MTETLLFSLSLAGGVIILLVGGDALVRGASALAARLGIRPLIVGLTVVAFGTSAPELALNLVAAFNGNTDLSLGNIVGSNIANIGLVLGVAAMIRAMKVDRNLVRREIPIMVSATVIVLLVAYLPPDQEAAGGTIQAITRMDGVFLLAGFVLYMVVTLVAAAKQAQESRAERRHTAAALPKGPGGQGSLAISVLLLILGLIGLGVGGKLAEHGAVGLAELLGWSQQTIGLTVVAVATSLPELATSIIAARKGETDLAVGNIVGSNIFNLLLILGATAVVAPISIPANAIVSLLAMTVLAILVVPMSFTANRSIARTEGVILLVIYVATIGYQLWAR